MQRRKALIGLSVLTGGVLAYPAFKWISWHTTPDIAYLQRSSSLLASISDTLIPPTESPGASACGVHNFIIKMISDCTNTPTSNKFIQGLKQLENHVQSTYGQTFQECSTEQRIKVLRYFEEQDKPWTGIAGKIQNRYLGNPFFQTLKRYCAEGYCTSEQGATLGLRYDHVPSKYIACEPYRTGEKAWATF
jgi:Gluconate 2-dehydrogenase subunit 3